MSTVLAIDPGTTQSAYVVYDGGRSPGSVIDFGISENERVLEMFRTTYGDPHDIAIEMVASYGMAVGREVFETCVWIGRFHESFGGAEYVYRKDVKMHLCQSMRAKDGNIRQAILDLYPPSGGGKTPQVGTKSEPGPLYGVSSHVWSALAVAITYSDKKQERERLGTDCDGELDYF